MSAIRLLGWETRHTETCNCEECLWLTVGLRNFLLLKIKLDTTSLLFLKHASSLWFKCLGCILRCMSYQILYSNYAGYAEMCRKTPQPHNKVLRFNLAWPGLELDLAQPQNSWGTPAEWSDTQDLPDSAQPLYERPVGLSINPRSLNSEKMPLMQAMRTRSGTMARRRFAIYLSLVLERIWCGSPSATRPRLVEMMCKLLPPTLFRIDLLSPPTFCKGSKLRVVCHLVGWSR